MSENNFEKSVQQEMEGFKLKPSEDVWAKVEERIRGKKKRRIFFILFFLFGFALLGYWQKDFLFDQDIKETGQIEKNKQKLQDSGEEKKEIDSSMNEDLVNRKKTNDKIDKEILKISEQYNAIINALPSEKTLSQNQAAKKENSRLKEEPLQNPEQIKTASQEKSEQSVSNTEASIKKDTIIQFEKEVSSTTEKTIDPVISDTVVRQKAEIKKNNEIFQTQPDSSNTITQKQTSSKKWKWGFLFTPGISSLGDGILSLSTNKSAELFAGPNTSGSGAQNIPAPPSASKAGFAFQAGTFLKNQYVSRSSFSIGLQYSYYSEHISVGARKDTVLRYASQLSVIADANYIYSAGGAKADFTNSYHFIEIPAVFQFQINKKKTSPINWIVGLSIGQLITARSLAYDTSFGGIYYDNRKNLTKTQFSLTTGFSWGIFNDKRISGSVGPVVDLHFNSLINSEVDKNKHLFFAGLRSTISFSKK